MDAVQSQLEDLVAAATEMRRLAELSRASRSCHGADGRNRLIENLEQQARICDQLDLRRANREAFLETAQVEPTEYLTALLAHGGPSLRDEIADQFAAYVQEAEILEREVAKSREYFGAALSALEGLLDDVAAGEDHVSVYGPNGAKQRGFVAGRRVSSRT